MWYSMTDTNIIWLNVIRVTVSGDSSLLGCDAGTLGEWFQMFWRNILPSFSRVKWTRKNCQNRLRMTRNWRLWVYAASITSVARSASDWPAVHWDQSEETPPTHPAWVLWQLGCGSAHIQPWPWNPTWGHRNPPPDLATFTSFSGKQLWWDCIPTTWTGRTWTGHGSYSENARGLSEMVEMPMPTFRYRTTSKHTST